MTPEQKQEWVSALKEATLDDKGIVVDGVFRIGGSAQFVKGEVDLAAVVDVVAPLIRKTALEEAKAEIAAQHPIAGSGVEAAAEFRAVQSAFVQFIQILIDKEAD